MKKKKCGSRRLPKKYDGGATPNYYDVYDVGRGTLPYGYAQWNKTNPMPNNAAMPGNVYTMPTGIELPSSVTRSMDAGWNNSINAAGNRVAKQGIEGATSVLGGASNIASSAIGSVTAGMKSFESPTLDPAKTTMSSGPIQYTKTERINSQNEYDKLRKDNVGNTLNTMGSGASLGAAVGSVVPGVGTLIGGAVGAVGGLVTGLFGNAKRKRQLARKIRNENKRIDRKNDLNLSTAHTDLLQQDYNSEVDDAQNDVLYNNGKTPFVDGKDANALVGKGETIIDGNTGNKTEVTQGSGVGNDDVPAVIKQEDAVLGNKENPRTGNTFAEDMKPLTRMENKLKRNNERNIKSIAANTEAMIKRYTQPVTNMLISEQAALHKKPINKPEYNAGKIGQFALQGAQEIGTLMPSIYNMIQGSKSPDYVSDTQLYSPNANASRALNKMSKRRYDANPEIEATRDLEARQRYNARMLGSEGGLNRAMDIAGAINTQKAISNTYAKKQNIDNQYLADEASMMASLGAQEASNKTQAMQQAYDINAKNKAMQQQYTAAGLQGLSQYAQLKQKNANQSKMDRAKMRVLEKYYGMGTTQANTDYILGGLLN